jgi:hypothetical protein
LRRTERFRTGPIHANRILMASRQHAVRWLVVGPGPERPSHVSRARYGTVALVHASKVRSRPTFPDSPLLRIGHARILRDSLAPFDTKTAKMTAPHAYPDHSAIVIVGAGTEQSCYAMPRGAIHSRRASILRADAPAYRRIGEEHHNRALGLSAGANACSMTLIRPPLPS